MTSWILGNSRDFSFVRFSSPVNAGRRFKDKSGESILESRAVVAAQNPHFRDVPSLDITHSIGSQSRLIAAAAARLGADPHPIRARGI
ncbi:MAG TPA: hypothetical protein VJR47_04100 [Stellaceae bacterium]|nr:hypothetical protein [Stellaceae bacterium]